jgi:chromosome segregation ATPase
MIWIELLLSATAVLLAAAAFKRADSAARQSQDPTREAAIHQDLAELFKHVEALPGRIADETSASPLREALESVRESIQQLGETFGPQADSTRDAIQAAAGSVSQSVEKTLSGLTPALERIVGLDARLKEIAAAQSAQIQAVQDLPGDLRASLDAAGSKLDARLEALERIATATRSLRESLVAPIEAIRTDLAALPVRIAEEIAARPTPEPELQALRSELSALPARIAEEVAARPAPAPELEELAAAVRDSGHLRGDVAEQVAHAVSSVSRELADATAQARQDRDAAASTLDAAMVRLEALIAQVGAALKPLESALSGHGETVRPLAQALESARAQLEEAGGTQRANQVEFSASVDVFTRAAQELSSGLSAFAREGDREGAEDPRKAQAALLEALERILSGFSESLRTLLSESDLRTRETLAELAARLPGGQESA